MNGQTRMPDPEARERHALNVQAACQKLERFTTALDDLIAQLESETCQQPNKIKSSCVTNIQKQML